MTWSHNVERCWSGGICSRITFGASTSMNTLSIIDTTSSPGSGYFQACNAGWPTFVSTRYISPTLRWSCLKVAIFLESGDHNRMGLSLLVQDRKSTRLNSSHTVISYAVFCLKKKKQQQ